VEPVSTHYQSASQGVIATSVLVVNAAAPTVFAGDRGPLGWGLRASLLVGCAAAWLAMELMSRWYERRRGSAPGRTRPAQSARWHRLLMIGCRPSSGRVLDRKPMFGAGLAGQFSGSMMPALAL